MFTFKFESSLNYRKVIEEQKLVAFSDGKKRIKREKELLEGIRRELLVIMEQFKNMQEKSFRSSDVALCMASIALLQEQEIQQQEIVLKINREVDVLRKDLLDAVKNRKIMDNMKERHLKEFNDSIAARERKNIDETAVLGYVRNKE